MDLIISIYDKTDGTHQVSFIHPLDQKRKRKHFGTKKEAEDYKTQILLQNLKGSLPATQKRFVGHLLKVHMKSCPNTRIADRKNIFRSFCNAFNHFEIEKLSKTALEAWFSHLQKENDYTDRNMAHIKTQINHFIKWLLEEEVIQSNPLSRIKYRQNGSPRRPRVILSKEEIKDLLEKIWDFSDEFLYPFIYTIVHTGARRGEVVNLKWKNVDFNTNLFHLIKTKNGDDRYIRMSGPLRRFLKEHPKYIEYVFRQPNGNPIARKTVDRLIKEFKTITNYPKNFGCHDLRHSFAYNFLKAGGDMYQLKAILGHRTIQMTVDLYGNYKAIDVEHPSPFDF